MAIVRYQGIEIECSPEEAVQIAQRLGGGAATPIETAKNAGNGHQGTAEAIQRVRGLFSRLGEDQQRFLREIAENSYGKNEHVLAQSFNKTGKALGGMLSPIGKAGKLIGISSDQIYTVKTTDAGTKEYRPTELLRTAGRDMGWTVN